MSKVVLPYTLKDGQIAYATKVMANLNAMLGKLNNVSVPGLPNSDMEEALQQLKYLLDAEYAADAKVVESFTYNGTNNTLDLKLQDGALFTVDATPFFNDYAGQESDSIAVAVDGSRAISAQIKNGAITYSMLAAALQALLSGKVTAGAAGNASQILFSDGQTMQEKLDAGELNGTDGVALAFDSYYTFRVGENGHLYVGVADGTEQPSLAIDENGRLIYSVASSSAADEAE